MNGFFLWPVEKRDSLNLFSHLFKDMGRRASGKVLSELTILDEMK